MKWFILVGMTAFKNSKGSIPLVLVGGITIVIIGLLGFALWNTVLHTDKTRSSNAVNSTENIDNTHPDKEPLPENEYSLTEAIRDIRIVLMRSACETPDIKEELFLQVTPEDAFSYEGGISRIDTNFSYAYVQFGCGSQGSIALLERADDTWSLLGTDARMYPLCDIIIGRQFPNYVVDRCYPSDRSVEAVPIGPI